MARRDPAYMTASEGSLNLTCVRTLEPVRPGFRPDDIGAFAGTKRCGNAWWVYGGSTLFLSANGVIWDDLSSACAPHGDFKVSSVACGKNGSLIIIRCRGGLRFILVPHGGGSWRWPPELPTGSSDALAVGLSDRIVICVLDDDLCSRFKELRDSSAVWRQLPSVLPGPARHFEMNDDGSGLCALGGTYKHGAPSPSVVYRTQDFGISWSKLLEIGPMLLAGAASDGHLTLLGGADGYMAEGGLGGFRTCEVGLGHDEDIVAVCSEPSQQAAVFESMEEPSTQGLFWRKTSSEWHRYRFHLPERITGVEFIRFGTVLLCTRKAIYIGKTELTH